MDGDLMVSDRAKGAKFVKEAMALFMRDKGPDWTVAWKPGNALQYLGPGRFRSTSQDIMGGFIPHAGFDFQAMSKKQMCLVQVKSNEANACTARKAIEKLPLTESPQIKYIVMSRIPKKPGHFITWFFSTKDRTWTRYD